MLVAPPPRFARMLRGAPSVGLRRGADSLLSYETESPPTDSQGPLLAAFEKRCGIVVLVARDESKVG